MWRYENRMLKYRKTLLTNQPANPQAWCHKWSICLTSSFKCWTAVTSSRLFYYHVTSSFSRQAWQHHCLRLIIQFIMETCARKHQRQRGTPQVAAINLQQVLDNTFTAMCRRHFSISMHKWWFSQQMFPIIAAFSAPCLRRRWLWLSRLRRRRRRASLPEELMDSLSAAKRIWLQTRCKCKLGITQGKRNSIFDQHLFLSLKHSVNLHNNVWKLQK